MRPLYIVLIVLTVVAAVYFWRQAKAAITITNYPSQGTDIIAFGDSLVAGSGATEGHNFVDLLSQQVGEPIVNLGHRGDTTTNALARISQLDAYKPKAVIVLVGGNDYIDKQSMEQAFVNLGEIIKNIQSRGAVVVLVGVRLSRFFGNFDQEFETLAKEYNTAYVPHVLDGILGNSELMSDDVHPNDAGYALIAERILPVLKPLIQ